jgi:imidazolonepropionase-like amidohydrolase
VVAGPGKAPVTATVVVRDGIITQVSGTAIPPDAYHIPADSLYVYPAFIDAFSKTGIKEPEEGQGQGGRGGGNRVAVDEDGNASLEDAGITPFAQARAQFDPKAKSIEDWRGQGFAVAHVVPRGRMLPGMGAIAILTGGSTDEVLWKEDVSQFAQWNGASNTYPNTIIGVMAKWRDLYRNTELAMKHSEAYAASTNVTRPVFNRAHEALMPVVAKQMPVYFRAPGVKDIYRALDLHQELGMKLVLTDAQQAWHLKDQLKTAGMPVVVSLDLPEDKSKEEEKKTEESSDSTKTIAPDPEKVAFEQRRAESYKEHVSQAGMLANAGIPLAIGTYSGKSGDFFKNVRLMIANGLTADQALAALTTGPASLLGIDKYCGTVENGKMANLLVSTKPVFDEGSAIRYMIVEGRMFEYEVKEKKKKANGPADENTMGMFEGTWAYTIEAPDRERNGTFVFTNNGGGLDGKITGEDFTGGNSDLEGVAVTGHHISFTFPFDMGGQSVSLEFDLKADGDTLSGTVAVGEFGSFKVTARRTDKPKE